MSCREALWKCSVGGASLAEGGQCNTWKLEAIQSAGLVGLDVNQPLTGFEEGIFPLKSGC